MNAIIISFLVGALLHAKWRNWFFTVAVPVIATFCILGYLESKRPYAGGGASFYILIQIFVSIYAGGSAALAALLVTKFFPKSEDDEL